MANCNCFPGYFPACRFEIDFYTCSKRKWWLLLPFSDLFLPLSPLKLAAWQACQLQVTQPLVLGLVVLPSLILHFLFISQCRKEEERQIKFCGCCEHAFKGLLWHDIWHIKKIIKILASRMCYLCDRTAATYTCTSCLELMRWWRLSIYCSSKMRCW